MATPRLGVVRLEGADGRPLEVEVLSGARQVEFRPAVVVCHAAQESSGGAAFRRCRERLAVAGFAVLSFQASAGAANDHANLATVVDYAVAEGAPWIGLLGAGVAVGPYAAEDARVKAVVLWGGAAVAGGIQGPASVQSLVVSDRDPLERTVAFFCAALA